MRALHPRCPLPPKRLLVLAITLALGACDRQVEEAPWTSPIHFDTVMAWVHSESDSTQLLVELAKTESQHQFGMMTRPTLDAESGMIFLYDSLQTGDNGFWMFRTRVPLDIAFLDRGNMILAILTMDPCPSPDPQQCQVYQPGIDYWAALEVNRGWFARHGIEVGGRIELPGTAKPEGSPPGS